MKKKKCKPASDLAGARPSDRWPHNDAHTPSNTLLHAHHAWPPLHATTINTPSNPYLNITPSWKNSLPWRQTLGKTLPWWHHEGRSPPPTTHPHTHLDFPTPLSPMMRILSVVKMSWSAIAVETVNGEARTLWGACGGQPDTGDNNGCTVYLGQLSLSSSYGPNIYCDMIYLFAHYREHYKGK